VALLAFTCPLALAEEPLHCSTGEDGFVVLDEEIVEEDLLDET
jgi:hypothetical protein